MNRQTDREMDYNTKINGGVYADVNSIADEQLPDNKKALRNNLAQQLLHEKMIDMQYNK